MKEICPYKECTGCMACGAICAHNAIIKENDSLGFTIPKIREELCTDCGVCKKICPSLQKPVCHPTDKVYASVSRDKEILKNCASGGIATLISKEFIKNGGIVYGCSGENIFHVRHIRVDRIEDLHKIQGTKYVQSDISDIFRLIREDLLNGNKVLCIGLSCQIAGIRKFLMRDYENLYSIDMICHGGPSQRMIDDDVKYIKRKFKIDEIENIRFRHKVISNNKLWVKYGIFFSTRFGEECALEGDRDPFTYGYSNNLIFRDSCYQCKYTNLERVGDLTIGDFWQLGEDSGLTDKLGVSLLLTHTDKGSQLLKLIDHSAILLERELEEAVKGNPQLVEPTKFGKDFKKYRKKAIKSGIVKASNSLRHSNRLKRRIRKVITLGGRLGC